MSQPFLNFFQTYAVCIQETCATVAKIVKANLSQAVLLEHQREMLCDKSRLYKFTDFIDIDVIGVFFTISSTTQLAILLLPRFQTVEQLLKRRDKR